MYRYFSHRLAMVFTVVLLVGIPADRYRGAEAAIVETLATGLVIDQLGGQLRGAVDRARQSGDFLAMRAAQEAVYVLDAFKDTSKEILGDAFNRIGGERQAVLNGISEAIDRIESGRVDTLDRLREIGDQFDGLVRDVTFQNYPVIYRYRGTIVTPGENREVRLVINGYALNHGKPYLEFRGRRYDARSDGRSLRVELPRDLFTAAADKIIYEDATLVLERPPGWLRSVVGSSSELKKYELPIITLPRELAKARIGYAEQVEVPHSLVRDEEVAHNSSSRNWDCRPFAYSPAAADRRFDPTQSSVRPHTGNGRGELRDVRVTNTGVSFAICAKRRIHDRDNGYRHAIVHLVEVWKTERTEDRTSAKPVSWTATTTFEFPDKFKNLSITVTDFTGVSRTVSSAGGTAGRYVTVKYDAQSNLVLIDPIKPDFLAAL